MIGNQPDQFFAEEQAPHLTAAYAYVIQHDDGTRQHWTSYSHPLIIENLNADIDPAGTATFATGQIRHGSIASNDRFEGRNCTVSVDSDNARLRQFFLVAAAVKLKCWIIRIALEDLEEGTPVDFQTQAIVVESGILAKFAFTGQTIAAEVVPEPFFINNSIPRFFCERSCNHPLYGAGCDLDKTLFQFTTTIIATNSAERTITINGRKAAAPANYFEAGYFDHPSTGLKFAIAWSAYEGAANTKLKLGYWHPELEAGDALTAYAGCRHNVDDCTAKFANQAKFGGFPYVPNKNPIVNGP